MKRFCLKIYIALNPHKSKDINRKRAPSHFITTAFYSSNKLFYAKKFALVQTEKNLGSTKRKLRIKIRYSKKLIKCWTVKNALVQTEKNTLLLQRIEQKKHFGFYK